MKDQIYWLGSCELISKLWNQCRSSGESVLTPFHVKHQNMLYTIKTTLQKQILTYNCNCILLILMF